jgi:hypothetical protein
MAHAYTPGLRVTPYAILLRERRLPLKGDVLVRNGDAVEADTVVARCELPGNVQTVNLASKLSLDPARAPQALTIPLGSTCTRGQIIAEARSMFGLMKNRVPAPADGTLESVSGVTGQLILREPPIPVEVDAFVQGVVADTIPGEGVIVETRGAFMQGIFGVGAETFGEIAIAVKSPDDALKSSDLKPEHRGRVIVAGAYVSHEVLMAAKAVGVAAVVVGGFDDHDLRQLLGKDLGVAITGSEDLGFTLVLTEGFGHIRMADRTWKLLNDNSGRKASVSGATQIRAGVMRPEILIPLPKTAFQAAAESSEHGLEIGTQLRVIRQPHFGRIGRVVELPPELRPLESEARVRVVVVAFDDDGSQATVPRANVEIIAQ